MTVRRRTPPGTVNHSARALGEVVAAEGDSRKLFDLGMELVKNKIPVSFVFPRHSLSRDGCPVSPEGDGRSLESSAEEALALASLAPLVFASSSLQLRC